MSKEWSEQANVRRVDAPLPVGEFLWMEFTPYRASRISSSSYTYVFDSCLLWSRGECGRGLGCEKEVRLLVEQGASEKCKRSNACRACERLDTWR